jgi:bifunctional UDP-N-acetylglucosamine pyrophosphorylase / glucosamine-1-phosphate N-acetyltransferase
MLQAGHLSLSTIILAAGEGTRMRSATPKVLHRIAGRSLVDHAVRAAAGLDPDYVAVVVGHGRDQVAEHLEALPEDLGKTITLAVQERQNGTGHAVSRGLAALPAPPSGTVLVTYGDVPLLDTTTLSALLDEHLDAKNAVTVLTAAVGDPSGYGRILRDAAGTITGIVEHKDATEDELEITEINSGIYAFDAAVLSDALTRLRPQNAQGELYLTDVVGIARADGKRVGGLVCADPWLVEGVNDRVQLAAVGAEYNRRLIEQWMLAGVTVIDPATVWLDAGVELARDVLLEPGVQLRGRTVVGEGAVIGPDTTLTDVQVGAGASVVRTHGRESRIGPDASVGPFAYLRPGSVLGERGKIGTFVEVKNSEIGTGSKVPHLSYVGDATIGEYTNIGAASVFVNYDGVAKHRSVVGSYARTGSDNMFVAPVHIGDGAYTGAGAVIRRDVPPGSLAVSGGPQRILDQWVLKHRQGTPSAEAARRALDDPTGENERAGTDLNSEG